jgi:ABC-type bacteriocin/lantibiotic exporter with double-glycine peptidase domain
MMIRAVLRDCLDVLDGRQKRHLNIVLIIVSLSSIGELAGIAAVIPIVTLLVDFESAVGSGFLMRIYEYFGEPEKYKFLFSSLITAIIFVIFGGGASMLGIYLSQRYIRRLNAELSSEIFSIFILQKPEFYLARNESEFTRNVNNVGDRLAFGVVGSLITIISRFLQIFVIISILSLVDFATTLVVAVTVMFSYLAIYTIVKARVSKLSIKSFTDSRNVYKLITGAYRSYRNIIIDDVSQNYIADFVRLKKRLSRQSASIEVIGAMPRHVIETVGIVVLLVVAYWMGMTVDKPTELVPILGLYGISAYKMLPAAQQIYHSVNSLLSSGASFQHMKAELDFPTFSEDSSIESSTNLGEICSLKLCGVTYDYGGKVVGPFSYTFDINSSFYCIKGVSGAGKSTLVDILLGIRKPTSGEYLINNVNISDVCLRKYWDEVAYVGLDGYIFDGTVKENIERHGRHVGDEALLEVVGVCEFDSAGGQLEFGLSTELKEGGVNISSGQKARILIARSLLKSPKIIFIDESFSVLDYSSAGRIITNVRQIYPDISIIMVSHRDGEVPSDGVVLDIEELIGGE